ncbi:hypothetical protein QLX08_003236 [Tetragonisca angustula]|uniref:Uncharacterized protein n=1 Tax=Tetragonisca angustula TaxID=166442 RepID=A0AAW1A734_9HYME
MRLDEIDQERQRDSKRHDSVRLTRHYLCLLQIHCALIHHSDLQQSATLSIQRDAIFHQSSSPTLFNHTFPAKSNSFTEVPRELTNEATTFFYIKHTIDLIGHRLNRNQQASNQRTHRSPIWQRYTRWEKQDGQLVESSRGEPLILGVRDTILPMSRQRFEGSRHRSLDVSSGRVPRSLPDNEISPVANLFPNSRASGGVKQPVLARGVHDNGPRCVERKKEERGREGGLLTSSWTMN